MAASLKGKKVAILATDYFEEKELTEPLRTLKEAGAAVVVIAPHAGKIKGLNHMNPGQVVDVDLTFDDPNADPVTFDAVVIPGGTVNADHLRMEEKARDFVRKIMGEGKPTASICHGPWLLVSSGLVRGHKLTSYYTIQDDITRAGGEWTDQEVVIDHNLITSRSPDDLPVFNKALVEALASQK